MGSDGPCHFVEVKEGILSRRVLSRGVRWSDMLWAEVLERTQVGIDMALQGYEFWKAMSREL